MKQLQTVLPYVQRYWRGLAAGLAFVALSNAAPIATPWLTGVAIDALRPPDVRITLVLQIAALVVVVNVLNAFARFGMRQMLNGISRRVENDLRQDFFAHLTCLDAAFYGTTRIGDLMSRATNDTQAVRMAVGPGIMYLVNTLITTALSLLLMLRYSPKLTAIAIAPLLLLPFVMVYFGRLIHRRFDAIQDQFGVLSTMVQENLSGVRIVRAYVQEEAQAAEFDTLNRAYLKQNMDLARTSAAFHPLLTILTGLGLLSVVWFGGIEAMNGRISLGDFVAFSTYLIMLTWPMIALGWVVNLFQRGAASMARIDRIMNTAPVVTDAEGARPLTDTRGDVEFRDVSFRYPGSERDVLSGVSFTIPAGTTTALVGPTGSGKSTIVSLLTRQYDATSGDILVDGIPARQLNLDSLRRAIAIVPQDAFVFSDTIREHIAFGANAASGASVERAAEVAQLAGTIAEFPNGFETRLGERGVNLSGGQRQRTTLARAIARNAPILILDDALSAVDTHTERDILLGLRHEMARRTAIMVSHRVSAVMDADQILVLDHGRIVEQGRHAELVASGGLYSTLLRRQLLEEALTGAGPETDEGTLATTGPDV
ncbi:MAG: ABC transporter ATP-binding protein [Longimicrobiales bacterium]